MVELESSGGGVPKRAADAEESNELAAAEAEAATRPLALRPKLLLRRGVRMVEVCVSAAAGSGWGRSKTMSFVTALIKNRNPDAASVCSSQFGGNAGGVAV